MRTDTQKAADFYFGGDIKKAIRYIVIHYNDPETLRPYWDEWDEVQRAYAYVCLEDEELIEEYKARDAEIENNAKMLGLTVRKVKKAEKNPFLTELICFIIFGVIGFILDIFLLVDGNEILFSSFFMGKTALIVFLGIIPLAIALQIITYVKWNRLKAEIETIEFEKELLNIEDTEEEPSDDEDEDEDDF